MLKLLDLFSGIGGFSLGLESTGGFETIAFVEKDDFCQKVLKKHWPNITIEGDIRNVKGDKYEADVITGGFPCQPFSVAGKRKGTDDDRYLWDETIRVVRECKPRWFIGENVEGLININNGVVLRQVQTDLEKEGFEVQCLVIPASGIGAWHQRKRIWILAHNVSNSNTRLGIGQRKEIQTRRTSINNGSETLSNSNNERLQGLDSEPFLQKQKLGLSTNKDDEGRETWWQTQSRICRIPDGVSFELDKGRNNRIKSLGNSIVPQIVRQLGFAILEAEK